MDDCAILVTCEHGGNRLPKEYRALFAGRAALLAGHRGYDPGAADLARELAAHFDAPLVLSEVTRLLVDLNRSEGRPTLFSEITRGLPRSTRRRILERHYHPYRRRVESWVARLREDSGAVLHLSVHSFTPHLGGETRGADVGLLYDPKRPAEVLLAGEWRRRLGGRLSALRIRMNYPYRGTADGLTTSLRRRWDGSVYRGIEIEVNQAIPLGEAELWDRLKRAFADSLAEVLPYERRRR